jgi:hypothetical protein
MPTPWDHEITKYGREIANYMYKPRRDALLKRHERVLETLVRMSIEGIPLYKESLQTWRGDICSNVQSPDKNEA